MILHIWATDGLPDQTRRETAPYAKVIQKPQMLAIAEPLQLDVDVEGLLWSCPLLRRCLLECQRLYCPPIYAASVKEDFSVLGTIDSSPEPKSGGVLFKKGTYVVGMHTAIGEDSWGIEGSLPRKGTEKETGLDASLAGTTEAEGNPSFIATTTVEQTIVERTIFSIVAGCLALWDFSPQSSRIWELPKPTTSSPVGQPRSDVRTIISQKHPSK